MSDGSLIIGLPSKGRLMEDCFAFFAGAGLHVRARNGGRDYVGGIRELPAVEVRFLSSGEIAGALETGELHLGVTGKDLVYERAANPDDTILLIEPLGFGFADVVVAVPQAWIDVATMEDVEDVCLHYRMQHDRALRVATKYLNLTRHYFNEKGITDYRIVESSGATEGAPAAGMAELIVDITTTGSTLSANNLKVLEDGVILKSEAHLAASLRRGWSNKELALARELFDRISARAEASGLREVRAVLANGREIDDEPAPEGAVAVSRYADDRQRTVLVYHCPEADVYALAAALRDAGAERVTVLAPDYIFLGKNDRFERLKARLA